MQGFVGRFAELFSDYDQKNGGSFFPFVGRFVALVLGVFLYCEGLCRLRDLHQDLDGGQRFCSLCLGFRGSGFRAKTPHGGCSGLWLRDDGGRRG